MHGCTEHKNRIILCRNAMCWVRCYTHISYITCYLCWLKEREGSLLVNIHETGITELMRVLLTSLISDGDVTSLV